MRIGIGIGIPMPNTRAHEGGAPAAIRLAPGDADTFYVVRRQGAAGQVLRFQRDIGGSSGTDAGVQWPEFRITGEGVLAGFDDTIAETVWVADDTGAFDFIGRNPEGVQFGSYHGLGAAGSLTSESILIDGEAADHTVATEGNSFEIRNETFATDGTDSLTRDLSVVFDADGARLVLHSASHSGLTLFYFGMLIGSGDGYDELQADYGGGAVALPLGQNSNGTSASLLNPHAAMLRDTTSGAWVSADASLPDVAGFVRTWATKQPSLDRTKCYFGQFSDTTGFADTEIWFDWGIGAAGATPVTNILPNDQFASPQWFYTQTNGTVAASSGVLTMTKAAGVANLRCRTAGQTNPSYSPPIVSGRLYAAQIDYLSRSGSVGDVYFYMGSTTNGSDVTPTPAMRIAPLLGRNIEVFRATQDNPNQVFAVRTAGDPSPTTTWGSPAVYEFLE